MSDPREIDVDELRETVDTLEDQLGLLLEVASRMAHGEPSPSPTGTSSAGGSGQRPPAAPSTETRQAAQDGQSGSGGDATDGVPAHQPTPQVGDEWEYWPVGERWRVVGGGPGCWLLLRAATGRTMESSLGAAGWRLVERDGNPWPPAQESEPVAVEPATDRQIAAWSKRVLPTGSAHAVIDALVARFRQVQARAENAESFIEMLKGQRSEAQRERDEAAARAEAAEAALARVERVADLERAVVEATLAACGPSGDFYTGWRKRSAVADAVRALRDAQETGS